MTAPDDFPRAVEIVLEREGLLSNDPHDAGGVTKYGISQRAHPKVDIANLTRDGAIAIYRSEYWTPSGADRSPWPLSLMLFDSAVNQGATTAVVLLQKVLGSGSGLRGEFGLATAAAVRRVEVHELTARFCAMRLQAYALDRDYKRDGFGWFCRVFRNIMAAA